MRSTSHKPPRRFLMSCAKVCRRSAWSASATERLRSGIAANGGMQQVVQTVRVDRLEQIVTTRERADAVDDLGLGARGEEDHRDRVGLVDLLRELQAVALAFEIDVHDDDIRA